MRRWGLIWLAEKLHCLCPNCSSLWISFLWNETPAILAQEGRYWDNGPKISTEGKSAYNTARMLGVRMSSKVEHLSGV